jgi:hypothetical protein
VIRLVNNRTPLPRSGRGFALKPFLNNRDVLEGVNPGSDFARCFPMLPNDPVVEVRTMNDVSDLIDDQTPESLCKAIITRTLWEPGELVLEPAKGDGNFYRNLPGCVHKDWCEIKEGKDFFDYWKRPDTIITNPPYRDRSGSDKLLTPFLEHSLELAYYRVMFLVNHRCLNACKPNRLNRYATQGWALTNLSIYSVRKWSGLYYLLTFVKGGQWAMDWDAVVYE